MDYGFGNGGAEAVRAVMIQPDGNIVAIGSVRDASGRIDIALARYLDNSSEEMLAMGSV